jgi:hypothetical protein
MLEAGQYHGQQAYYPDWQAAGVARPATPTALSRPEAIRLYEINLAAYQEASRRRERHMWFFAAVNFVLATASVVMIAQVPAQVLAPAHASAEITSEAQGLATLVKVGTLVALVIGWLICRAWSRALDQCRHDRNLAVDMVRKLEEDFSLRYSPLGEETKPDPNAELAAKSRERFAPRALLGLYLALAIFVCWAEIQGTGSWLLDTFGNWWNNRT